MTRSRVCPDTEFTGLSPAADALPETAIISDTGVPLLNTLICPPDTFKARPVAQAAHGSRRQWYVINPRRMNRYPGTGLLCRTRMSSSATPVLMSVSLAICWSARDRYSAVCWPGPATSVNGPGGTVTGACTTSTRQQLPSVLTGQVISIALWQMPGPAGQCGST